MIRRGLVAAALAALLLSGCARPYHRSLEPSPITLAAPLSQFAKPRSPVRHVVVGCEPCSIYSLDVGAQRAAYPIATAGGRVEFMAALKRGDRVSLKLYRRVPCR